MDASNKEVRFDEYCSKCRYKDDEKTDKCEECLETPVRYGTRKPLNFKEK